MTTDSIDVELWEPMRLDEVRMLLGGFDRPWWISGGQAIDLFVGRKTRDHGDTDVGIRRCDLLALRDYLRDWDVHKTHQPTPSRLAPWAHGQELPRETGINNVWARRRRGEPWRIDFTIMETAGDRWIFRRDERIGGPFADLTVFSPDGLRYLRPEIQLLYKSRRHGGAKDDADFAIAWPLLDTDARNWLRDALHRQFADDHRWFVEM
ncbi:MAG: hypothetical protein IT442_10305 [Phycisphaeraceae bacterium]|nr:hypothetical protein [Phycisphaeraceae bacterium]